MTTTDTVQALIAYREVSQAINLLDAEEEMMLRVRFGLGLLPGVPSSASTLEDCCAPIASVRAAVQGIWRTKSYIDEDGLHFTDEPSDVPWPVVEVAEVREIEIRALTHLEEILTSLREEGIGA